MKFRLLSCIILSLFIVEFTYAQEQVNLKRAKLKCVSLPEDVKKELINHLKKYEPVEEKSWIYAINMHNQRDFTYKDGVYSVYVVVSHPVERLFINYKGRIKFFKSVFVADVLQEYADFIRKENIPFKTQIYYLKGIMNYFDFATKDD